MRKRKKSQQKQRRRQTRDRIFKLVILSADWLELCLWLSLRNFHFLFSETSLPTNTMHTKIKTVVDQAEIFAEFNEKSI